MRTVQVGQSGVKSYFEIKLLDGKTPALSEAGGQPLLATNGGTPALNGIGLLVATGFGKYTAPIDPIFFGTIGDIIETIYHSGTAAVTYGDTFQVGGSSVTNQGASLLYYGSITDGNLFFSTRLNANPWTDADPSDQLKSLRMATMLIDRLNFAGNKADSAQYLEFPRMNNLIIQNVNDTIDDGIIDAFVTVPSIDVQIPEDIVQACYLIALKLLDGFDPDFERDNLQVAESKYSQVGTKYERTSVPDYVQAGIPSATAWSLIKPYLRDPRSLTLSRDS